jgi:anti-sigma-K factor RskA
MTMTNHIAQDDLYLFALQLQPEQEMRTVSLHLKECPLCSVQLADIEGDLATYALTAEMQAPPSQARERLLNQIALEKKVIPLQRAEPESEPVLYPRNARMFQMEAPETDPRRGMGFAGWAGWAIAAGIAVVAGLQFQQKQTVQHEFDAQTAKLTQTVADTAQAQQLMKTLSDPSALQVSLHIPKSGAKPDPEGHAVYVPGKASLVFVASNLDPLKPSKTYELWLLPQQAGVAPIAAGLFRPDASGNASVIMPPLPPGVVAKGFGVTIENDGGSKTPTAPIILAGM